jgi:tRNA (guanine37-N1)-methyltransferase
LTINDFYTSTRSTDGQRLRLLAKSARGILDDQQLRHLWKGVDIVGDIAVLKLPHELEAGGAQIAENLLNVAPYVKVVLAQVGPVESRFRTRKLEWLAGEKRTVTLHKESGCRYRIDLCAVYFSPRLSHERKRIADLVSPGECVVNFFAGVGTFSIMIARHAHPSRIYSLDINPAAIRYHLVNSVLNGVNETIDLICGDANKIVAASLVGRADRVLLPLPELAFDYLPVAKSALKNGHGVIHCYAFVDASRRKEVPGKALLILVPYLESVGIEPESTQVHVVRSVGPCRYQICLDMKV